MFRKSSKVKNKINKTNENIYFNNIYLKEKIKIFLTLIIIILIIMSLNIDNVIYAEDDIPNQEKVRREEIFSFDIAEGIIDEEIEKINFNSINNHVKKSGTSFGEFDVKKNIKNISLGKYDFNTKDIFFNIVENVKKIFKTRMGLALKIGILSIMSGFIKILADSFKSKDVSDILYLVIYVMLVSLIYDNFLDINDLASGIASKTTELTKLSVPILTTLLVASGKVKTAALFEPFSFTILNILNVILERIYLPMILTLLSLIIINNVSKRNIIKEMIDTIKKFIESTLKAIVGFVFGMSIFSKVSASIFDGTLKSIITKGATSFIPVVGRGMENSIEIFLNCANLLKNSSGIVIIISYIVTIVSPMLSLIVLIIIYRLTLILIEPIAETRIKDLVKDVGDVISFIFTTSMLIVIIFVINITMIFS